jgi:hypothetical protein
MGLSDKTNWERWSVRELLCLGYNLGQCQGIEYRRANAIMELPLMCCDYFCNLANDCMSIGSKLQETLRGDKII